MTSFRTRRFAPYCAESLFLLAGKVEDYPHFVMFCHDARMINTPIEKGKQTYFDASLTIGYPSLNIDTEFTSHVTLDREIWSVSAVGAPQEVIRSLTSRWDFIEKERNLCQVDFFVSCSLQSRILQIALDRVFSSVAEKIADSFIRRAEEVYGIIDENSQDNRKK